LQCYRQLKENGQSASGIKLDLCGGYSFDSYYTRLIVLVHNKASQLNNPLGKKGLLTGGAICFL